MGTMKRILQNIFGWPTILVVEPDEMLRQMELRALSPRYQILPTGSVEEAVRTAARHETEIDLLLTEARLPRIDGWELADLLRLDYPHLKVIYLSSSIDPEIRAHTYRSKVIVLENPFRPDHLRQAVREVLKAGPNDVQLLRHAPARG